MEEEGYKETKRKNFMEELENFFDTCYCFTRTKFKDICPPTVMRTHQPCLCLILLQNIVQK